jgi:accessory gene regulator B
MIARLAGEVANYYANKNLIERSQIKIYKYGFELLISTLMNLLVIASISIILGTFLKSCLFLFSFIPLRLAAGGYHAKHHWSCILGFNIVFLLFILFLKILSLSYYLYYSFAAIMVSSLFIWSFAPVEAVNKPLTSTRRKNQRFRCLLLSNINLTLVLLFFIFPNLPNNLLPYYASGSLCVGIFLIVAKVAYRKL